MIDLTIGKQIHCLNYINFNRSKQTTTKKQKSHDEIANLYIGPWGGANFNPGAFI
jgi:hypothetical protein